MIYRMSKQLVLNGVVKHFISLTKIEGMKMKPDEFPYNQSGLALDELEKLIIRVVEHELERDDLLKSIADARERGTVPIRGIQHQLMQYRKKYSLYTPFSDDEKQLIDHLLNYWG
ncbi:hypothetical protein VQ7734_03435 [Vibrio quintilis]|uniref:Uncharacterized protein n=1 Tax=Vibrio quintilis TaxID=1117707 RepID=A0A1M7YYJ8_9VIBR|nr:hypothetical protein VQ7734_03435 [Vibrio quintilis]